MSSSYPGMTKHHEEINTATAKIESSDPSIVIQGLNALTKKTFEALETHSVHFENYPQLAISLGSLLSVVNPLAAYLFSGSDATFDDTAGLWAIKLPNEGNPRIKALAYCIDDNTLLLSTLNILRNLSFDVVNEQVMGASAPFLQHLVALVLISIESGSSFQATHLAAEVLINIGAKIDLTGKKRLQGYYFSENANRLKSSTDVLQKNLLQLRVNRQMSTASSTEYLSAAYALMSAITVILSGNSFPDRSLTLRTIELLGRVASNADNAHYLSRSPEVLFSSLAQLLCASTTFAEPLVSDTHHVNGDPLGRRRPLAAVCLSNRLAALPAAPAPTNSYSASNANLSGNASNANMSADSSASSMNITFGGVRLEPAGSGGVGPAPYGSAANLEGLSSHNSSSALAQRPANAGPSGGANSAPANAAPSTQASFFNEFSDLEVRDQVLETLHALCLLGAPLQLRLLQVPRLVEVLLRIATSTSPAGVNGLLGSGAGGSNLASASSGGMGGMSNSGFPTVARSEGVIKALQILALLLAHPEASSVFLSLQSEFIAAACSDDFIAEVVCNKALPVQQDLRARLAYSVQQAQLEQQFAAESQSQQQGVLY